jgi:sugar phosphate isomerase/epimerase
MKIGISSHTYKWSFGVHGYPQPKKPLDGEQLIVQAATLGLDLVQFGDNYPLHLKTEEELVGLRSLAKERNVELEIGTTGTAPEHLLSYLEIARRLDAHLLRSRVGTQEKKETMEAAERNLGAVLGEFEESRVFLALENYELHPVRQLADLIERVDNEYLGACLDTGNSIAALETPDMVVDALAPHALCLHIKDFLFRRADHGLGYIIEGCPIGEGVVDVESVFGRLRTHGRLVSVVLEQWTPYQGNIEDTLAVQDQWAKKSLQYLKRYLPHR